MPMTEDRDLALILLAGIMGVAGLISGVLLACIAHMQSVAIVAVVGGPSGIGIAAIGRLGGPKPAPAP